VGYPVTIDEQMLVSAVRYALGRSTYITSMTADAVRAAWVDLSRNARAIIQRDLYTELESAKALETTVGMATDHREWATLYTDILRGDLNPERPRHPAQDDPASYGLPTDAELDRLLTFQGTPRELIEYARSLWNGGAGCQIEHVERFRTPYVRVVFVTGGFSGCESVIDTLNRTLAYMFASKWEKGGYWEFEFSETSWNSDKPWDWAILPRGVDTLPDRGPYAEVRDRLARAEQQLAEVTA